MNNYVFLYWPSACDEYEKKISSIDIWDPVKFEVANAARTRHSNQWIRYWVSICRGRLYTAQFNRNSFLKRIYWHSFSKRKINF